MNLIIESNIPFTRGVLDNVAEVRYLDAADITPEAMRDTDALITRTRTRCNAALLDGSRCRFIATATIGTDHIDLDYCRSHGITVANAPGCNAPAVAQYVMASIDRVRRLRDDRRPLSQLTIGIVGVGHVGSIVESWARGMGMNVLPCDPPRAEAEGREAFVSLDRILAESDIITFHTPLTSDGPYPTYHLLDSDAIKRLVRKPIVINAARGPVTDDYAIIEGLDTGLIGDAVIDCWENEPAISPALLEKAAIATPHIAGYSREGKIRATTAVIDAFTDHYGMPRAVMAESVPPGAPDTVTMEAVAASYDPMTDTEALRRNPQSFEALRNHYAFRDEVG